MKITHCWTEETAAIRIAGLTAPVRMLHVTDVHVALLDNRDAGQVEVNEEYRAQLAKGRQDGNGRDVPTDVSFDELMAEAAALHPDLIALTGDIVHFPAPASIEHVARAAGRAGVPILYCAGNHDWRYPAMRTDDATREAGWRTLAPLYGGHAACDCREIGGIQFLLVDDSTYQLSAAQLDFIREQLGNALPTVILTHIPFSLPTLRGATIERWHAPILVGDPDWDPESRLHWGATADSPSTLEFLRLLAASENLVAVFCGHLHFAHADAIHPRAVQYVGPPGFAGKRRLVEFLPL